MLGVEPFDSEREVLTRYLEEKRPDLDDEVAVILETFLELIIRFPDAVRKFDLSDERLHEFMAARAEEFLTRFTAPDQQGGDGGFRIEVDNKYIFNFVSVSLVRGSAILLYPFMLVRAANYQEFIPSLLAELKGLEPSRVTVDSFLNVFFTLSNRSSVPLSEEDVDFISECLAHGLQSRQSLFQFCAKRKEDQRFLRLFNLSVLTFQYPINYPVLGLIPYIHLTGSGTELPGDLQPFVEIKSFSAGKELRVLLLPVEYEREWQTRLVETGLTSKIDKWYLQFNWDAFTKGETGTWGWQLDVTNPRTLRAEHALKDYFLATGARADDLSSSFITLVEAVHGSGSLHTKDLMVMTGLKERTVQKYSKRMFDMNITWSVPVITRIGLDGLYLICFENSQVNQQLVRYLESFPKFKAMTSRALCSYLLYVPPELLDELDRQLAAGEREGTYCIMARDTVIYGDNYVPDGVDLVEAYRIRKTGLP